MQSVNRYALKEQSDVCRRLAEGGQILLLRKGGIEETRDGFRVEHREFFLYPGRFHEGAQKARQVRLEVYAVVEEAVRVNDLERLKALHDEHAMTDEEVEKRFHYGKEPGVWVLALRAYRLAEPQVLDETSEYAGCRSWVELGEELPVRSGEPALQREAFRSRLEKVRSILHAVSAGSGSNPS